MNDGIEFLSAVLLVSENVRGLAAFYRDVLGLPLKEEVHGDTEAHYGCELGDVHFAIHPRENFDLAPGVAPGRVRLAFGVVDIHAFAARLAVHKVTPVFPPRDVGFAMMTALNDPDGNYIEVTELADRWFEHLERRRTTGHDVVAQWRTRKGK
jgi:catechol 2,3-dioxygenase-like lactoylglutathione lyase family enzyme